MDSPRARPWMWTNFGVTHQKEFLALVMPAALYYPRSEQQKLADMVTRSHAADFGWCRRQLTSLRESQLPDRINATAVGNLAYLALRGPEILRAEASALHADLIRHYIARMPCDPALAAAASRGRLPEPTLQTYAGCRPGSRPRHHRRSPMH